VIVSDYIKFVFAQDPAAALGAVEYIESQTKYDKLRTRGRKTKDAPAFAPAIIVKKVQHAFSIFGPPLSSKGRPLSDHCLSVTECIVAKWCKIDT